MNPFDEFPEYELAPLSFRAIQWTGDNREQVDRFLTLFWDPQAHIEKEYGSSDLRIYDGDSYDMMTFRLPLHHWFVIRTIADKVEIMTHGKFVNYYRRAQ